MSHFIENSYPLYVVSAASGVNAQTIKSYLNRYLKTDGVEITGGGGPGHRKGYPFFTIVELCVARAFMELGVNTERAFAAAQRYAHVGDGGGGWALDENPFRSPALPYHVAWGKTYICADAKNVTVILCRNINGELQDFDKAVTEQRGDLNPQALIRIDAWPLFADVIEKLGGNRHKDTYEVLEADYPKDANA